MASRQIEQIEEELRVPETKFIREFPTGATRDKDTDKLDYEGFISPLVEWRYANYMHKNRLQKDGSIRASDNWTLGILPEAYVKSLARHVQDVKLHHRGFGDLAVENYQDSLCGVIFNAMGLLFEDLKERRKCESL